MVDTSGLGGKPEPLVSSETAESAPHVRANVDAARIGIPTRFKGIKMRSRTEARVAAFFDELRWPWDYEPFDLAGYIPDFVLNFRTGQVIVEVKGATEDVALAKHKIEFCGWNGEAIIVSRNPGPFYGSVWCLGDLLEKEDPCVPTIEWHKAELHRCLSCGEATFTSDCDSWACRVCGASGGNSHLGEFDPSETFARAVNRVQWRPNT